MQTLLQALGFGNPVQLYCCPWQSLNDDRVSLFLAEDDSLAVFCIPSAGRIRPEYCTWRKDEGSDWSYQPYQLPKILTRWQGPVLPRPIQGPIPFVGQATCSLFISVVAQSLWPSNYPWESPIVVAEPQNKILDANGEPAQFSPSIENLIQAQMDDAMEKMSYQLFSFAPQPAKPPAWMVEMNAQIRNDWDGTMRPYTAENENKAANAYWMNLRRPMVSYRIEGIEGFNLEEKPKEEKPGPGRKFFLIAE